ncbi:LINE-1 retrotransposable element ORF2 protein [Vitis vinifera]|uniref:LINE-1 retrotransposable element ORF2 protein n=1 Tax=Vitis vinifera TaxID=29760 RepID=A0A438GYS5_VITVI|nr:LINE-1 retrotransposable element ORF2 protein [Vitis vinifera]
MSLWWECWPVMRRNRRNEAGRHSSEVISRVGQRVTKEWVSVRLETLNPSDDGMDVQGVGSGRIEVSPVLSPTTRTWALTSKIHSLSPIVGPKMSGSMDLKMKGVAASDFGPDAGPSFRMEDVGCYAKGLASPIARSSNEGLNCSKGCSQQPDPEPFVARESEDTRKLQGGVRLTETDRALEEESMRYGMGSVYEACNERINGCKELGVTKSNSDKGRGMEGVGDTYDAQVERSEPEGKWEESGLARFRNVENGVVWVFTGVYDPFSKVERDALWEEFGAIRGLWEDPWCLGGDFNITLFPRERSSQRIISSAMRKFAEIVNDLGLVDLPLQGGECSWNEGQNNQTWARLDRFLVSLSWIDQFSGINQCRLPRSISDHFPIMLVGGGIRRGPTPFRFENMWLKAEGFKELVCSWWQGIDVRGSASYKLATKMKEIKQKLKVWNREVFELKKEAKENYRKWVIMEETHWRQLSREIWLKEVDRNTGFFHRMASAHQGTGWKADIGRLQLDQISQQEAENLERPFTEDEIHAALMEMNEDKAPGPDGFTLPFWQSCWEFIKEEILEMFKEFYEHSSFLKSLNNTFLVLIPKKSGVEDLGDFRPISLLEGLYKLLTKVLANRLKIVVGKVVSTSQNAFVRGRQILYASLIANEVIDSWQKRKEKGLICKLDIEKSYDSFFPSSKGLRQGDPLSPYLFVMGMEVLDVLIRRAVEGGFLSGCNIRGAASGLRINLAKSEIIPVGEVVEMEELAVELGCRVGSLPSQYLGLPLGAPNRAPYMWDEVEERVRRRIALWKRQYISKGGRVTLIKNKDKGGLSLRKLAMLNKALLGKWIWRYACDEDNLWKQVIKVKYGQEDFGWRPKKANGASREGQHDQILDRCVVFRVSAVLMFSSSLWDFNDWELELVGDFLHILRGHKPSLEEDSVLWRKGRRGQFKVKEVYSLLARCDDTGFPSRSIWVARVPTKVAFFTWEATWGKVLTLDRLQRRGLQLPNHCFLCGCEEESVNHILIHCTVVRAL